MKVSVKTDYACRAVEALALHYPNSRPMRIEEIAQRMTIPANFLVQILIELKGKGLIRSHRGKAGGYLLARSPREITLGDVVRAIHGELGEVPVVEESTCPPELLRVWQHIKQAAESVADNINFETISSQAAGKTAMYYI